MPIYEYACQACGEGVEKLQKMSDAPLTDCPICGESALKRKVSAAGFRLAGGGWYETDFKSDGRRNLSGSDDSSSASKKTTAEATKNGGDKPASSSSTSTGDKTAKPSAPSKTSDS